VTTQKQKELLDKILKASEFIAEASRKQANWIVCSKEAAEIIANLDIKRHRRKKLEAILKSQNEKTSE
jgi:hypothetical protein